MKGLLFLATFYLAYMHLVEGQSWPGCQQKCGNVAIEYPFGTSPGCYYAEDRSFNITCNERDELIFGENKVIDISHDGELRVMANRSYACYDKKGKLRDWEYYTYRLGNLTLSTRNKFTAVGCDTLAFLSENLGSGNVVSANGGMLKCKSRPKPTNDCSGIGCFQTSVSIKSKRFKVGLQSLNNHKNVHSFNPCSYAFVVEDGKFHFSSTEDLKNLRNVTEFPVVLDWSIGNMTSDQVGNMTICDQVGNRTICGGNSTCVDSVRGKGYNCKCSKGFEGNPYLSDGCKDIDECTSTIHKHNCWNQTTCKNTVGDFLCMCDYGYQAGNTTHKCTPHEFPTYLKWTLGVVVTIICFLMVLLIGICCKKTKVKPGKKAELRQHFFRQNGGLMLKPRLSREGVDVQIYPAKDMKTATDGYDGSRILCEGCQGTVYKGILPDDSVVAIKRVWLGDHSQVEWFINEVLVLSRISHSNVVKFLGCCLETEVPLLVFEFINSGTLFDHLHGAMFDSSTLTWEHRLRIAIEIAGALTYLHSTSIPIIHRDVKTANIVLDGNLTAKLVHFGPSGLNSVDKEELATMGQDSLGYLDPEYKSTGRLNGKSDVYSFGVVLMELLSGKKAVCFEKAQQSTNLVSDFVCATKENRLHEVIDVQVMNENNEREIQEAARIAVECTRLLGNERPRMKEVVAELEALRASETKLHKWSSDQYPKEYEHLLGLEILSSQGETTSTG